MIIYIFIFHQKYKNKKTDNKIILLFHKQNTYIYISVLLQHKKYTQKKPPHVYPYYRINHLSLFL